MSRALNIDSTYAHPSMVPSQRMTAATMEAARALSESSALSSAVAKATSLTQSASPHNHNKWRSLPARGLLKSACSAGKTVCR